MSVTLQKSMHDNDDAIIFTHALFFSLVYITFIEYVEIMGEGNNKKSLTLCAMLLETMQDFFHDIFVVKKEKELISGRT